MLKFYTDSIYIYIRLPLNYNLGEYMLGAFARHLVQIQVCKFHGRFFDGYDS